MNRRFHPELKLGCVLAAAVVLLEVGDLERFAVLYITGFIGTGPEGFLWISVASSVGGLGFIFFAVLADRNNMRLPLSIAAAGVGFGALLLLMAPNPPTMVIAYLIRGLGSSGVSLLILSAVAAKASVRYTGTLIGLLVAAFGSWPSFFVTPLVIQATDALEAMILVAAIAAFGAAFVLYRYLPAAHASVDTPQSAIVQTSLSQLLKRPGFWRRFGLVALVFSLAGTMRIAGQSSAEETDSGSVFLAAVVHGVGGGLFPGLAAIAFGVAADFVPVRRLLLVLCVGATATLFGLSLLDSQARPLVGAIPLGIIRGGLTVLPWVLLARHMTVSHFAKMGLALGFVATTMMLVAMILTSLASSQWGSTGLVLFYLPFALALGVVAISVPARLSTLDGNATTTDRFLTTNDTTP